MSPVPRRLTPLRSALLVAALASLGSAAPAAAAVQPGVITGTVRGSLPTKSKGVVVVRAINASTGAIADVATVSSRRTFRLVVDPGAYAVRVTVSGPGRPASERTLQVTVADGQHRSGLRFTVAGAKATRTAAAATASRAYVSTDGTEVAGVTAYSVEPFSGGTGDWKDIRTSIAAALQTETQDLTSCSSQAIANKRERSAVNGLRFRSSSTVAKGTKVERNLIVGDVSVGGKIKAARGGKSATLTVTFVDQRSGKTFDTVKATLRTAKYASNERALARVVAERLCRRPVSYKAVLSINGTADFADHSATGKLASTLTAAPTGGTGGQPDATYTGKGALAWTNLVFTSKKGCAFSNPVPAKGEWSATVTSGADGQLTVDWGPSGPLYFAASTATANCPGVRPASGQAGPSLVGLLPNATKLPSGGGTLQVSGALPIPGASFSSTGTLAITPVWKHKVP